MPKYETCDNNCQNCTERSNCQFCTPFLNGRESDGGHYENGLHVPAGCVNDGGKIYKF